MATTSTGRAPAAAAIATTFGGPGVGRGVSGGGELLSSVAAVRELLLRPSLARPGVGEPNPQSRLADELSAVQQSRYEDRVRFEQERQLHVERIEALTNRLQQAKRELEQEQAIRKSLDETNEALEKHKDELTTQLEELSGSSSTRLTTGGLQQGGDDGASSDEATARIQALEQEKMTLTNQLSQLQQELSQVKTTSDDWKKQCLVSQRQVQGLQVQLESFQKEFQVNQDRQRDLLHTQDIQYESFRRRLEESIAARKKAEEEVQTIMRSRKTQPPPPSSQDDPGTIPDTTHRDVDATLQLTEKYQEAQEAKVKAEERVRQLELELESLKRASVAADKVEKENKAQEQAIEDKLSELNESLVTIQSQVDTLTKEVQSVDQDPKNKKVVTEKKEELSMSITKLGTVLESIESQLKEKLALTKTKIEEYLSEMKRIREELTAAKTTVTAVQSEIIECQQKQKKLLKVLEESSTVEKASAESINQVDAPTAEAVAASVPAGTNDPKKRTSADTKATPTKRKKTKK